MPSSSSSLGLTRQVGSRIAGVSQIMRMQASSICRRSNSFGLKGPSLCQRQETGGLVFVFLVACDLLLDHRHEIGFHRAAREFGLDVGLAAAEHHRLQAATQFAEILVVDRPPPLVEFVEVAVEAEQRPDQFRVEILHNRIELVDAVFNRRAG